jgi:hypothetical protein
VHISGFGFRVPGGRLVPAPFLLIAALLSACGGVPPEPPQVSGPPDQIQWEYIKTWTGRGSQFLDSFPSEGTLRIEWEATRTENATTPGTLKIVMHSAISGRSLAAPVVDQAGEGKGIAYFSEEPRVFFISIISQDVDWKLNVSERVR